MCRRIVSGEMHFDKYFLNISVDLVWGCCYKLVS